ncbi:hypothetical protein EW145_g2618 [Phellinidium pouzarii]|uniref:Histone-lysine N-methyltransferase SET5 n=1 Tax=Phellinidium pouzarii TaxID=167371 RepID=A0A4S4LAA6_9AGAM|nr:hypothetical protein EW145_g2618 [Phellinidium pouzarii]
MPVSPTDDELKDVLKVLRSENPILGVTKLQTRLLAEHPDWSVSEKRVKKLLAAENLLAAPPPPKPGKASAGKGLVAIEDIKEGEDVWKEDPFIIAPECRGERIHPLLCPATNPASIPLLAFARRLEWMACHAAAQCIALVLIAHEQGRQSDLDESMRFLGALAQMGMEERWKAVDHSGLEPDRKTWKTAHTLTVQAFHAPPDSQNKKRLLKILRKPIPDDLAKNLFDFDSYLQALDRMSLNLEAHGGIYMLHSHLNHCCTPNLSVRHFDIKTAIARITIRAKTDIKPGEELLITYVNPELPFRSRRRELTAWAFGPCACARCVREEQEEGERGEENNFPVIEEELKHGLGLL